MTEGLLAPRLYRAAFAPALFALIVLAFSLQQPSHPQAGELAPPGFSGTRAVTFADQAVRNYGARSSGSTGDRQLADLVEARLQSSGFRVTRRDFNARTLNGRRTLTNVVGVRVGTSDRRMLVLASRDGSPGRLQRSGALETGALLELARVVEGRSFRHTLVLASVSGGNDGGLGAAELIGQLGRSFDAVVVLRNIAVPRSEAPVLSSGDGRRGPDPRFLRTLRGLVAQELGGREHYSHAVPRQLIRLGFPVALGEQAALLGRDISAASISLGGEPLRAPGSELVGATTQVGQSALRALATFDRADPATKPQTLALEVGGKLIPQWALILLIGALWFPLVVVTVDAWARARRRQQATQRGVLAPSLALGWLLLIGFLMRGAAISGVIHAPPLVPDPAAVHGVSAGLIGGFALLLSLFGVLVATAAVRQATAKGGEAGFALWLVFSGLAVFVINPFASAFLLLLVHLLVLLLLIGGVGRKQLALMLLVGIVPLAVAALDLMAVIDLAPTALPRFLVLLTSGGFVAPLTVVAGCAVWAAVGTASIHLWWKAAGGSRRVSEPLAGSEFDGPL